MNIEQDQLHIIWKHSSYCIVLKYSAPEINTKKLLNGIYLTKTKEYKVDSHPSHYYLYFLFPWYKE